MFTLDDYDNLYDKRDIFWTFKWNIKLILQLPVYALRAVYVQILKKSYGTRTLLARHTHGFLPVDCT